jgi:integrase
MYIRGQTSQGTLYKRDGVYYANYSRNGKQVRVSLHTKIKSIAVEKFHELIAHPSERMVTFDHVVKQALFVLKNRGLKSYTIIEYHSRAVKKAFGSQRVEHITPRFIQQVVTRWQQQGSKPATINRRLYVIRQAFKQAQISGYISRVPTIANLSENGNARQGFFTQEEFEKLYVELPDYLKDPAEFGYLTGWRRSEITKTLTWSCMDWQTMVLRLPTSKNSEGRVFPIVQPRLEALLKRRFEQRQGDLIFHRNGQPLGDFKRAWNSANRRVGMRKLFHDLRRTAVRNFVAQGLPDVLIMKLTGHKTNHMLHRYHITVEADLRKALLAQK